MNKVSLRKRFVSLALAAVMMLGMAPVSSITAWAISSNPLGEATVPIDEVIAKNGGEKTFTVHLDNSMSAGGDIIYSEMTKPSTSGHNRGLGMYLGQVDPNVSQNEGAGSFAFCYDHTKEADGVSPGGMQVTVNETHKEDDPLPVLIYYNGYTDIAKNANYVKNTLFDVMDRVWDYEYNKATSDWAKQCWTKPDWFTSGWQDKLSDGDWRRATQLALWMSQKINDSQSMLYISVHHYSEFLNDAVYKTAHVDFEMLRKAIAVLHGGREIDGVQNPSIPVRINANLVKGTLDYHKDVFTMIRWASWMGADEIRFSELQNCEELWVDSREIFPDLPADPFTCGCEQEVNVKRLLGTDLPIKVIVKMTCGRVNSKKPPVKETPKRTGRTNVLYPDAKVRPGWVSSVSGDGCHPGTMTLDGCHPLSVSPSGGCH